MDGTRRGAAGGSSMKWCPLADCLALPKHLRSISGTPAASSSLGIHIIIHHLSRIPPEQCKPFALRRKRAGGTKQLCVLFDERKIPPIELLPSQPTNECSGQFTICAHVHYMQNIAPSPTPWNSRKQRILRNSHLPATLYTHLGILHASLPPTLPNASTARRVA